MFQSSSMKMYSKSECKSTMAKMAAMTEEQKNFADEVYVWAEANYDSGGDVIVEATEPWELVKQYKTLAEVKEVCEIREDYAEDIRNA
jgi:hypothetical protein